MGPAILSQIVALLTFPGVVLHEVVEQLFCRWQEVAVLDVCYFRFATPAGYVSHEPGLDVRRSLLVGLGPALVNSVLGVLLAFPSLFAAMEFRVTDVQSYILAWLGISIAMHAHPSADEAATLWHAIRTRKCSLMTRLLATPYIGLMRLVSAGRAFGLDVIYGAAVVGAPPAVLLYILR